MSITATLARRLAVASLVLCAIAAAMIALLVGTANGSIERPVAVQPAAPAPAAAPVADEETEQAYTADEAFLADLFGPDTDYTPEQALRFTEVGKRYCSQVGHPESRPEGAEVATRDGYLAGMTMPGDPHALTLDEATKVLDTATAAYCPELFG